jgi:hypothetical protein
LTTSCVLCRKSTDLTWDEDEPSAAMAEEDPALATEESAPAPKQKPRRQLWELRCRRLAL